MDVFVLKYDANGNLLFAKSFGGILNDIGYGIAYAQGQIYITGWFADTMNLDDEFSITTLGGSDIFLTSMDTNGNVLWAQPAGTSNVDYGFSVAADETGASYITGVSSSNTLFGDFILSGDGAFIAKYDSQGNFIWANRANQASVNRISVGQNLGAITGRFFARYTWRFFAPY